MSLHLGCLAGCVESGLFNGFLECFGNGFDFSNAVIFFEGVDNAFFTSTVLNLLDTL
jgi:hypothetical protein